MSDNGDDKSLPVTSSTDTRDDPSPSVWTTISAFLSMKSKNTQTTYIGIIKEWCNFLGADAGTEEAAKLITSATDIHAAAYKNWLEKQKGQKPRLKASKNAEVSAPSTEVRKESNKDGLQNTLTNSTINKKFTALRRIYRALIAHDYGIKHNPFDTDRIPPPPKHAGQKRPTEMVSFEQVKSILEIPDIETEKGRRDRAILATLFGGGLRRSELIKLRLGDLRKTSKGTTFLRLRATKGKTDSDQALPKWAANYLWDLHKERSEARAQSGDFLFVSYRGRGGKVATKNPISPSGLYRIFVGYCNKAGIDTNVSPHSARATAITKLLDQGLTHREVQEFSRHASVQMVEVYDKRRISVDESPAKDLDFD